MCFEVFLTPKARFASIQPTGEIGKTRLFNFIGFFLLLERKNISGNQQFSGGHRLGRNSK